MKTNTGFSIGFTGIDGAGKSTQAALLSGWLTVNNVANILREGKIEHVAKVAEILGQRHGIAKGREYLGEDLYMVSSSFDLLREYIFEVKPYKECGFVVITARTAFCRLAAGMVRGCQKIEIAREIALFGGFPDLIIWLKVNPTIACKRVMSRGIDLADTEHLNVYQDALAQLLNNYPHVEINGDGSIVHVKEQIVEVVKNSLKMEV